MGARATEGFSATQSVAIVVAWVLSLAWMIWLVTADGLGSEGRWVVDRLIGELRELDGSIAEVEQRLAQVTADD